jgi:hypothetical protein
MQTPEETSSGESDSLSSLQICISEEKVLRSFSVTYVCCIKTGQGVFSQRSLKWRGRCCSTAIVRKYYLKCRGSGVEVHLALMNNPSPPPLFS